MEPYLLDSTGLVLVAVWSLVALWVALDTERVARILSYGRARPLARWQLLTVKIPAWGFVVGGPVWVLVSLLYRYLRT